MEMKEIRKRQFSDAVLDQDELQLQHDTISDVAMAHPLHEKSPKVMRRNFPYFNFISR